MVPLIPQEEVLWIKCTGNNVLVRLGETVTRAAKNCSGRDSYRGWERQVLERQLPGLGETSLGETVTGAGRDSYQVWERQLTGLGETVNRS